MNKKETVLLLAGISSVYPTLRVTDGLVEIWNNILARYEYQDILGAFQEWCTRSKPFAPSVPGDLLEILRERVRPTATHAEESFLRVIKCASPYQIIKRDELSPIERRIGREIGWDRMHMADVHTEVPWLRKEFCKAYLAACEAEITKYLPQMLKSGFAYVIETQVKDQKKLDDCRILERVFQDKL